MDLTSLRVAATLACFLLFVGIVAWTLLRSNTRRFEEAANLPFEQD